MEVRTLDLGAWQKALRRLAEQQHCGVRRLLAVEQVQVRQQNPAGRRLAQRKAARRTRVAHKGLHPRSVQILQRGARARRGIERAVEQQAMLFEVGHQRRIQRRHQTGQIGEAAADQLRRRTLDQRAHLRVLGLVVGAFHVDQARLAELAGTVEFMLGGRYARLVLEAVVVAEQAHIHVARGHLAQIDIIGTAVGRGQIFEQEDVEEAVQQRVVTQVVAQRRTLGGEFLLHAADEEALAFHAWDTSELSTGPPWTKNIHQRFYPYCYPRS